MVDLDSDLRGGKTGEDRRVLRVLENLDIINGGK